MKKKRRHNTLEIERKLAEAEALAADGRTQNEIAQELGISVMTIHRWRKAQPQLRSRTTVVPAQVHPAETADLSESRPQARIEELQLENTRLRKLITDLLLEKLRLEDEAQRSPGPLKKGS
jgi:putative transposase